uniref:Uncharacterized protein n=1 Tax=Cucumis melo subsp. melo TaxID=412675 RepID=E5GB74_CUCME|nr:hypothetical protein [Cucumis melo subsp. melo]
MGHLPSPSPSLPILSHRLIKLDIKLLPIQFSVQSPTKLIPKTKKCRLNFLVSAQPPLPRPPSSLLSSLSAFNQVRLDKTSY